jgi:glycerol kinase
MTYLLALDQGTSSSRSIVFDADGRIVAMAQREFRQIYPQPGWVEHDPEDLWQTQLATARRPLAKAGITAAQVKAIGITNQRETTVVWNRRTGRAIHNAIVWQDRRGEPLCAQLREQGHAEPSAAAPAWWWTPTSRPPRSAGSSTTCPAPTSPPPMATWPSARWTAGCCGS